ncbi:hypothetical protein QYF36_019953 [Acer negundo]|nr:hypothetical protein QYF36_019953 [Acer negundo]
MNNFIIPGCRRPTQTKNLLPAIPAAVSSIPTPPARSRCRPLIALHHTRFETSPTRQVAPESPSRSEPNWFPAMNPYPSTLQPLKEYLEFGFWPESPVLSFLAHQTHLC